MSIVEETHVKVVMMSPQFSPFILWSLEVVGVEKVIKDRENGHA